jgi:hypothetical protein
MDRLQKLLRVDPEVIHMYVLGVSFAFVQELGKGRASSCDCPMARGSTGQPEASEMDLLTASRHMNTMGHL